MCQQVFFCPEVQEIFERVFPLLLVLIAVASTLLIIEIMKIYALKAPRQPALAYQMMPQPSYSILIQAQKIVEEAEQQLIHQ